MKSFKEYLVESKKVYEFKIKIAGDCPKDCATQISSALAQYHVASCKAGKSTPIQETQVDFPNIKNIPVSIYDVSTSYPVTSAMVRDNIATYLNKTLSEIKVRSSLEEQETELNNQHNEKTGKAMLGAEYENNSNPGSFGVTHTDNFLKELSKTKTAGTQYTGVNDEMLAKGAPKGEKEKPAKQVKVKNNAVNIFTKQVKVPSVKGATK